MAVFNIYGVTNGVLVLFLSAVVVFRAVDLGTREDLAIGVPASKWQEEKSNRHQLTCLLDFQVGSLHSSIGFFKVSTKGFMYWFEYR